MKKKYFFNLSILIIVGFLLSACQIPFVNVSVVRGSGDITSESRDVEPFNEIRLEGAGQLVITQGDTPSLEISAEDNIIDELTSEVVDDTLILGYRDQSWRRTVIPTEVIRYTLTVTDLVNITLNGAGEATMEELDTESLEVAINGAGRIDINELIGVEFLEANITGAGTIVLAGEAENQSITIDGAGSYRAEDLHATTAEIEINGLGNATVWTDETLDIAINGAGNLTYYGSPNVTQNITGAGDIDNRGEK